jgi:hypothetical protein
MKALKFMVIRLFRLAFKSKQMEKVVWEDLKKMHIDADWKSGVYEREKYLETTFKISEDKLEQYFYMVDDSAYHCRVRVLDDFPVHLTTDLFILAAHFNNLLKNGVVIVHVNARYVEYHLKQQVVIPFLYSDELYFQLLMHHETSKDIYHSYQRLVIEQEAPAIIIADLLAAREEKKDEKGE